MRSGPGAILLGMAGATGFGANEGGRLHNFVSSLFACVEKWQDRQ